MTEPIYEFVRGKGWLTQTKQFTHEGYVCTMRKPNTGEHFVWTAADWDVEEWVSWANLCFCKGRTYDPDHDYLEGVNCLVIT